MEPREKFSPEFKEIVERIPDNYSTLLVWGLLFFVGLLILLSIIIKVPDRVTAEVRVTSTCPPITLRAQKQGKIRLLKKNLPCQCKAGEYIAILENPANTEHILLLKKLLYNKDIFTDSLPLSTLDDSLLFLGEVETAYYQYRQQRQNYTNLITVLPFNLYQGRLFVASDEIRVIVRYVLSGNQHLPSYEKVGVMEIVLVQHSVPA